MRKYISIFFASLLMCSCVDTVLLPDSKTVEEDFWQSKSDVSLMVNGAYKSMLNSGLISRLVIYGDFRSDELVPVNSVSNGATTTSLTEINTANIQTTNIYSDWSSFYSVINNCNIVLEKAEGVMKIDPYYTEGDYKSDCAQMKSLRALCYFYLVRAFRDVPYSAQAYINSSQELNLPQTAPSVVLQNCIDDLEESEQNALSPDAFVDWRKCGWINKDGIDAILADIYLWRASVNHDAADYQKCVEYCDKIIASKKSHHTLGFGEITATEYPLALSTDAFNKVFVDQNAEESIFELQFDNSHNSNTGICEMYNIYKSGASQPYLKASLLFGKVSASNVYEKNGDLRLIQNAYGVGSDAESYDIRKMVEVNRSNDNNPTNGVAYKKTARNYDNYAQNYIVYRLSDIMLMKAEAMTALASSDEDPMLRQAFNVVQYVNSRSIYELNLSSDSLRWVQNNSKILMESLVLKERMRELCFEGKRWYDLMRYNYRHVEGVDYTKTLAELNEAGVPFVSNFKDMLDLMIRKYSSGAAAVSAKMRTEPLLYMPVLQSQIKTNPNLKQNPGYSDDDEYEKN